jgi:hypothetical protein
MNCSFINSCEIFNVSTNDSLIFVDSAIKAKMESLSNEMAATLAAAKDINENRELFGTSESIGK